MSTQRKALRPGSPSRTNASEAHLRTHSAGELSAGARRLLYDMDMALLELREELGETAPVTPLTATYHNLLRRWADSA